MRLDTLKLALAAIAAALILGCSGESNPAPVRTPTTIATTSTAQPAETPLPPALPTPDTSAPGSFAQTVWLIDAKTGENKVLLQDRDAVIFDASFSLEGDSVQIEKTGVELELSFDGKELAGRQPGMDRLCDASPNGVRVNGREYTGITCGPVSPDLSWMTYQVDAGQIELFPGYLVPTWDQWAIDLSSNQRWLLQAGLRHCGGCDGRFGPFWSSSGRYLIFPELVERVFLADLSTRTTRELAPGVELGEKPVWAPHTDLLARPSYDGSTILDDLTRGAMREIAGLAWPATFDRSGRYLYSPAFGGSSKDTTQTTSVFDLQSMSVVAALAGAPSPRDLWTGHSVVAARGDSFTAALQGAPGCDGTTVYRGTQVQKCVAGSVGAAISPDGSRIAMARRTGSTGPVQGPGLQSVDASRFDIVMVDTATGAEKVVAKDAVSLELPRLIWKADSSYLLVKWPAAYGL